MGTRLARYAAPAAFLVAATIAILLIRSGLENGEPTSAAPPPATTAAIATTAPEPAPATTETAATTADAGAELYTIKAGDTLAVVAQQHGTSVEALLALNPDVDPVALTIGDRIRVK